MATYEEALKRAYASCPSNVPVLQAIQVSHSTLPDGDLWFVDRLKAYTLGLEAEYPNETCGAEPTTPGAEPTAPGAEPTAPGTEPTTPGTEPTVNDYTFQACSQPDDVHSTPPFVARYEIDGTTAHEAWESAYAAWLLAGRYGAENDAAAAAAIAAYNHAHGLWAAEVAAHDAWQVLKDAHDAWLVVEATHDAWQALHDAYTSGHAAWVTCIAANQVIKVFQPLAYEIALAASGEHGIQDLSINGCDVEGLFEDFFENVAVSGSQDPIMLTYRAYREDDLNTVQYRVEMSLSDGRFTVHGFSARATVGDFVNKQYLGTTFTEAEFPGLASRG